MDSDPEIQTLRADPYGLSSDHRGPSDNTGTPKAAIGDSCSPSDVFDHVQNLGHLTDKHNDPRGDRTNWRTLCRCNSDTSMTGTSLTRRSSKAINNYAAHRRNGRNWLGYGKKHSYKM